MIHVVRPDLLSLSISTESQCFSCSNTNSFCVSVSESCHSNSRSTKPDTNSQTFSDTSHQKATVIHHMSFTERPPINKHTSTQLHELMCSFSCVLCNTVLTATHAYSKKKFAFNLAFELFNISLPITFNLEQKCTAAHERRALGFE